MRFRCAKLVAGKYQRDGWERERERGTRVRERVRIKTDVQRERERERVPGRKPTAWSRVDFTRTTYNLYA